MSGFASILWMLVIAFLTANLVIRRAILGLAVALFGAESDCAFHSEIAASVADENLREAWGVLDHE